MPGGFRFLVKKRGDRSTGSNKSGDIALALFFAALFFSGVGFSTYLLATLIVPEWRVNHSFVEGRALVLEKRLRETNEGEPQSYRPEVLIRYDVDGTVYHARTYNITRSSSTNREKEEALLAPFTAGLRVPFWYDPRNPDSAVVVRGYTWTSWLLLLVPVSFVVAGGGGLALTLLNWNKSTERRAMLAQRARSLELLEGVVEPRPEYPTLPRVGEAYHVRGRVLAHRLPFDLRPAMVLVILLSLSVLVLGIAAAYVAVALWNFQAGRTDWLMAVFAASWVVVGALGLLYFSRTLVRRLSLAPPIVEISAHPLRPGQSCDVLVIQAGGTKLTSYTLELVCEEQATFQQGTNTRTERFSAASFGLASREDFELRRGAPLELRASLQIPPDAMHSFLSVHNEIRWKLRVVARRAGLPDLERSFPLVVLPATEGAQAA
ncbi:MAG: DUF3592 domain-containing protein [Pirellulales bacterium]